MGDLNFILDSPEGRSDNPKAVRFGYAEPTNLLKSLIPQPQLERPTGRSMVPSQQSAPYLLFAQHLPLVRRVCGRFRGCGEPADDLALIGLGGLLEAVAEYEYPTKSGFVAFAMPLIVGAILDYLKDRGWGVQEPGQLVTQKAMVDRVLENFDLTLKRAPTIQEIADAAGLSEETVLQTMESRLG